VAAGPTGEGPGGATTTLDNVSLTEVKIHAGPIKRHVLWAPDGQSFYVVEWHTGTVRKIAVDGLKEVQKAQLQTPCSWMTMSAEGLVVAANQVGQVYVVDPATLAVKRIIPAPGVRQVASAPTTSVAVAWPGGPGSGANELAVLDLKKGERVRQYNLRDLAMTPLGFEEPTMTPDGKYLFTRGGIEQLHRFKVEGDTLHYEQSSPRIAQNGQAIEVSPDGKWVALPSGGGNYGATPSYSTFVYSVTDLSNPALTINGGAFPRAVGFDPKRGYIYANNHTNPLMIFTSKGQKLKECTLPGTGNAREFVPHPDGGKLLLLTDMKLYYVVVQ
jgi:DNA-binding beta-propeller fold protein YncE